VAAIVTLPSLEAPFRARGVTTMVIPDPLPDLVVPGSPAPAGDDADGRPLVVAVCGWGLDEPIEALVASATGRPWRLVLTGRARRDLSPPPNVTLAGFLDERAYVELLARADAVVVLTERDDTLLSGAWEGIALERPLVLSGTAALRTTFGDGIVYVDADPASIAGGIDTVLADPDAATAVARLRTRFARENDEALAALAARLEPGRRS
jgi:glycosyltransferase involved in cell wall biosynthesis